MKPRCFWCLPAILTLASASPAEPPDPRGARRGPAVGAPPHASEKPRGPSRGRHRDGEPPAPGERRPGPGAAGAGAERYGGPTGPRAWRPDGGLPPADRRTREVRRIREQVRPDLLRRPEVVAELRRHARTRARLSRLEELAREAGKAELLPRIEKLRSRERDRHQRQMGRLGGEGGAP